MRKKTLDPNLDIEKLVAAAEAADEPPDSVRKLLEAGATDQQIAKETATKFHEVMTWRAKYGLPAEVQGHAKRVFAVDLFGLDYTSVQEVYTKYKKWEIPEFVVREPVQYEKLCRAIWFLRWKGGMNKALIAESIGVREIDVVTALAVYDKHLSRVGILCPSCGFRFDKRYGLYCSEDCRA